MGHVGSPVIQKPELPVFVGSITQGLVSGHLAPTEKHPAGFPGGILDRTEDRPFVGAIAKRLVPALSTGTPKTGFPLFHLNHKRAVSCPDRIAHSDTSLKNYSVHCNQEDVREQDIF